MKVKFISTLVLALVAASLIGADVPPPITVAVFDFTSPSKGALIENDLAVATTLIAANLSTNAGFAMVERTELQKILSEQALGASGAINPESAARIGHLTGAKVLVTGQFLLVSQSADLHARNVVIAASVIGTETGRVFLQRVEGVRSNQVALLSDLSEHIAQTITSQGTNLIAEPALLRDQLISQMIETIEGKQRPAVSFEIDEHIFGASNKTQTVATELGFIFKKAGFLVVDDKSDRKPDVFVTGNASAERTQRKGGLFTCRATLEIKAQSRTTGSILAVDRQEGVAIDAGKGTAGKESLENAADDLARRLLPLLAK